MKHLIQKLTHASALFLSALFLFVSASSYAAGCRLEVEPKLFSPNGDGSKDSVFFVPAVTDIKKISAWELRIKDPKDQLVKSFSGKKVLPKILTWEGQTEASGTFVSEGSYSCQFFAYSGSKKIVSDIVEVLVDCTPPAVELAVSSGVFIPGTDEDALAPSVTFYLSLCDLHGIDNWQLNVQNSRHKDVKIFRSTAAVAAEIPWDGKDDYYGTTVPNGKYTAKVTVWDLAGNKAVAAVPLQIGPSSQVRGKESVLDVQEADCGLVINLSSQLLFDADTDELRQAAGKSLDEVVNLLQNYPDNKITVTGHTDSSGSRERNKAVSSGRAWAVYSYLVKHGVAPARLTGNVMGAGSDEPIATNKTKSGRACNRRVEITILKSGQTAP